MLAKFVNNVPVLSRLLSDRIYHEFDINYTDPITGDSALHKAAKLGNLLSCQCLIQHGAVMQRNKAGLSPANIAEASGHRDVQVYLENRVFARNELPPPVPPITPLGLGYAPAPVKAGGARVWKQEDGVWEWCDAYLVLKSSRLEHYPSIEAYLVEGRKGRTGVLALQGAKMEANTFYDSQDLFQMAAVDAQATSFLHLRLPSCEERDEWMAALLQVVSDLQDLPSEEALDISTNTNPVETPLKTIKKNDPNSRSVLAERQREREDPTKEHHSQSGSFAKKHFGVFGGRTHSAGEHGGKHAHHVTRAKSAPGQEEGEDEDEQDVHGLYTYTAEIALPYPPDKRPELSIMKGEKFKLLHVKDDGYCLVTQLRRNGTALRQGYVPGNFLTVDNKHPLIHLERREASASSTYVLRKHGLGPKARRASGDGTVSRSDQVALTHSDCKR